MTLPTDPMHPLFQRIEKFRRRAGRVRDKIVTQAHGGGGKAMRDLIDDLVVRELQNPNLQVDEDQARFDLDALRAQGDRLAFTTDSYVVSPIQFPGADIGKLAVNGTINDLAVAGARPLYLSCGLILEEGLEIETLRTILRSMGETANAAGVQIVTGDTKVVPRGAADKLFINTAGIGVIREGLDVGVQRMRSDDVLLINGYLGDHGAAILVARGELQLETHIPSDCAALHGLIDALLEGKVEIHAMRDVTRGGLAAVVNEMALSSEVGIKLDDHALPVRPEVAGFCEILGLDPVHLANEGKLVIAVPPADADKALRIMQNHPLGQQAAQIGICRPQPPGVVTIDTGFGGERILDMLVGEQLPRIC